MGKAIPRRGPSSVVAAAQARLANNQIAQAPAGGPYLLKFVKNPEAVPSFSVQSLSGKTLDPAEWKGKVVILNFWATWCEPCRYEIPELESMQKRFKGSLQVVGLSVDNAPPSQVEAFAKKLNFDYPVAMASNQLQNKFGGILALPTSFVINKEGRVVQKHVGLVPSDYYAAEIAYLAGKHVNAEVKTFVDQGQVFPSNVKNAKSLPGVDMSHLTTAQRKEAMKEMSQVRCTCGCDYTVAQCRLLDPGCPNSKAEAQKIVQQVSGHAKPAPPAKSASL